jgi:hypothetical protein
LHKFRAVIYRVRDGGKFWLNLEVTTSMNNEDPTPPPERRAVWTISMTIPRFFKILGTASGAPRPTSSPCSSIDDGYMVQATGANLDSSALEVTNIERLSHVHMYITAAILLLGLPTPNNSLFIVGMVLP